ncbi:hypothetical protein HDV06_004761 [Boothiomyces sp. JEL0866]|nr:hypothetical protein HDV06_004761 [Boothiomyces sp. JEL0866]
MTTVKQIIPSRLNINTCTFQPSLPSPPSSAQSSPKLAPYNIEIEAPLSPISPAEEVKEEFVPKAVSGPRRCNYCGATSTPMWRHGPGEYTNLCNSCGVKWRRGKILHSGENRHHLCKPVSPPKKKKETHSPKVGKRKGEEELYWQRPPKRSASQPVTPEASPEPVKVIERVPEPIKVDTPSSLAKELFPQPVLLNQPSRMEILTNEFADLLEQLPAYRTAEFTTVLACCFQPKLELAARNGIQVEMTVLDIDEDTWDRLRAFVY